MLRVSIVVFALFVASAPIALSQEAIHCPDTCRNVGVEIDPFEIDVSPNGSSCDSWSFTIGGVTIGSSSDVCPAIIRYKPQCGRQVSKPGFCVLSGDRRKVLLYHPTCTCVESFFFCLDYECLLGKPMAAEEMLCFTEGACAKPNRR